jgi:hypothetical protein
MARQNDTSSDSSGPWILEKLLKLLGIVDSYKPSFELKYSNTTVLPQATL